MPVHTHDPKLSITVRKESRPRAARKKKDDEPKTPPASELTEQAYRPNIRDESVFWKPKFDEIVEALNPTGVDLSGPDSLDTEEMSMAKCTTIVLIEEAIEAMSKGLCLPSDFFSMKMHLTLAGVMKEAQAVDELLCEAQKLYETVLEEFPSEDEVETKKVGDYIRKMRESFGHPEVGEKAIELGDNDTEDI